MHFALSGCHYPWGSLPSRPVVAFTAAAAVSEFQREDAVLEVHISEMLACPCPLTPQARGFYKCG